VSGFAMFAVLNFKTALLMNISTKGDLKPLLRRGFREA
jgi:hypothetical protein